MGSSKENEMPSTLPKILFKTSWAWYGRRQGICMYVIQKLKERWTRIDHTFKLALLSSKLLPRPCLFQSNPSYLHLSQKNNQNGYDIWKLEDKKGCIKLTETWVCFFEKNIIRATLDQWNVIAEYCFWGFFFHDPSNS